jgi:hypothetical protein
VYLVLLPLSFIPSNAVPHGDAIRYPADALFIFSLVVSAVLLVLALWGWLAHKSAIAYAPRWRVRLLRFVTRAVLHGFLLPVLAGLMSPWAVKTNTPWLNSGLMVRPCVSSGQSCPATLTALLACTARTVKERLL